MLASDNLIAVDNFNIHFSINVTEGWNINGEIETIKEWL